MKLPRINLGVTTKRNFFDLKHDVSTTCDFGFVQPTIVQSLIPNSKIDVKSSSFLRLAPMPCPTFGRVKVQTDNVFVPSKDVQLNIDHMLAGTQYQTPLFHGTVSASDSIPAFKMFWTLIRHNEVNWNNVSFENAKNVFGDGSRNLFNQIFRFSFSTNQDLEQGTPTYWHDLQNDFDAFGLSNTKRVNYVRLIEALTSANNNNSNFYNQYFTNGDEIVDDYLRVVLSVVGRPGLGDFWSDGMYSFYHHAFLRPYEVISYASRADDQTFRWSDESKKVALAYAGMSEPFRKFFDTVITSENADFSFQWCPVSIPVIDFETENSEIIWQEQTATHDDTAIYWRLNIQLTPFGRKLFKIFNSCHMNFKYLGYNFELNKLYAYYKAWFDLYNPGRTLNWEDTNAYRLIHAYYDYPSSVGSYLYNGSAPEPPFDFSVYDVFQNFLTDLSLCNYYLATDNITVATRLPQQFVNGQNNSTAQSVQGDEHITSPLPGQLTQSVSVSATSSGTGVALPSANSVSYLDSLSVKLLERLYNFVNRESVLASRIEDILKTKYGIDVHTSTVLGRDDFYCQISDIMGTVNNEETALGEYAGRGLGSGDCKVHYEASQFGYFIQLVTVVPLGGYVQASERPLIRREDYYTPDFDSLGYEEVRESEVLGRESIINCFGEDKTFGFRPRYFNLKVKNNLNNGGFAFRSQRASFLPYCLDRLFSEGSYNDYSNTRSSPVYGQITYGNYSINQPLSLKPVEELRSIGLYETYGNYDRMFYDTTGMSDNFILHQVHDFKYYAPMKPIADSFDTVNDEVNDDVTKVEHN